MMLPKSKIIDELKKKAKIASEKNNFDYIGQLKDLKDTVTQEVSYINALFPEYTPHNNDYHFKDLFNIAEELLGNDLINNMNVQELFILSSALYAHDWGMAVSDREKELIINNCANTDPDIVLLPDENERFIRFLNEKGVKINSEQGDISIDIWREYVRQNHAERSGIRVQKFFRKQLGISEAVKKACEGHWLNFSEITKSDIYPKVYPIFNSKVNIRAIAIYVRLIDLLDITQDRTPYVLWKYVSPRNSYSKMEWSKHRALSSVAVPDYLENRIIKIDGSTDDHEVYASLLDLKAMCDEQFRGCMDILAEMNDSVHRLDISHIQWNINAIRFKPVQIRFEFNRDRMFQILGEQIYNNDPYVFLRELLQNSIDAIRTREELLKINKNRIRLSGEIQVEVVHQVDGGLSISFRDNGIGMNEHIIKNYLTVAGKSYYVSDDFKKLKLKFDPISKYGIGLLSCFSVSDGLEITTIRDGNIDERSALKIVIPTVNNYFRVETLSPEPYTPGTTINITIPKEKNVDENGEKKLDNITNYLCKVGAFSKYPILITEGERRTAVINPFTKDESIFEDYKEDYILYKFPIDYNYEELILPQDLEVVERWFEQKTISFKTDLGIKEFEGSLSYLIPKFTLSKCVGNIGSITFFDEDNKRYRVRNTRYRRNFKSNISSCVFDPYFTVYNDGILVSSQTTTPTSHEKRYLLEKYVINFLNHNKKNLSISRNKMQLDNYWKDIIDREVCRFIIEENKESIDKTTGIERIRYISNIMAYSPVETKQLLELYPDIISQLPVVSKNGEIILVNINDFMEMEHSIILNCPTIDEMINEKIWSIDLNRNCMNLWEGNELVVNSGALREGYYGDMQIANLINAILNEYYTIYELSFITPPIKDCMPLVEAKYKKLDKKGDCALECNGSIIEKLNISDQLVNVDELHYIIRSIPQESNFYNLFENMKIFNEKQNNYFSYGAKIFNINHPISRRWIIIFIQLSSRYNQINAKIRGQLEDRFSTAFAKDGLSENTYSVKYDDYIKELELFFDLLIKNGLCEYQLHELIPQPIDFVPFTSTNKNEPRYFTMDGSIRYNLPLTNEPFQKWGYQL